MFLNPYRFSTKLKLIIIEDKIALPRASQLLAMNKK